MTILQQLDAYYGRMEARGDVMRPGWSREPVATVLELALDGALLGTAPLLDPRGKPQVQRVPKWFARQGTGSTPFFLWDNGAYVLGLGSKDPIKTSRDHAAFLALHARELAGEEDEGLRALRLFLEGWTPDRSRVPGIDDKLLDRGMAFRLAGERELLHERPAAAAYVERLRGGDGVAGPEGFCLVRGARLPLVRLHPKIKGVDGASSAEVPLVSFNVDSFASHGKDQGFNAPTSAEAAFRYGAALNALLDRGGRNRMRIADSTVAFWADGTALGPERAEEVAKAAEDDFLDEINDAPPPPSPDPDRDRKETAKVGARLAEVRRGRSLLHDTPNVMTGVRFHVLALAPNAARLQVRAWLSDDFSQFATALGKHRRDVALEPPPWGDREPGVNYLLLRTTALGRDAKNIPDGLAGAVLTAVLGGTPYPRTWLAAAILRLRAGDGAGGGWHAAAARAVLSRIETEETPPMSLDTTNDNAAYQLGRLFAVLEAAQYAALGKVNASVAVRYYGAASATPARVFGPLLRATQAHISSAHKLNRGFWIEERMEQIIDALGPTLPTSLRMEEQGRFAIGFYHEKAYARAQVAAAVDRKAAAAKDRKDADDAA